MPKCQLTTSCKDRLIEAYSISLTILGKLGSPCKNKADRGLFYWPNHSRKILWTLSTATSTLDRLIETYSIDLTIPGKLSSLNKKKKKNTDRGLFYWLHHSRKILSPAITVTSCKGRLIEAYSIDLTIPGKLGSP